MGAQVRVRFLDENVCSETYQAGAPCQVGVKLQSSCHTNAAKSGHIIRLGRWENIHTFFYCRASCPTPTTCLHCTLNLLRILFHKKLGIQFS